MQGHDLGYPVNVELPDTWTILIVDDEKEIHRLTRLVLGDYCFQGRGLDFLSAYSAGEARELMSQHHDIALVLLDVVMETDDAGLELVRYIRERLENRIVQIVLRTGQAGSFPEHEVVAAYEINDYNAKTELTAERMYTVVTASLRAYQLACSLQAMNQAMHQELTERRRAEAALAASEEKYRVVVECANDGMIVVQDGVISYMNPGACSLVGAAQQMLPARIEDTLHPMDRQKFIRWTESASFRDDDRRVFRITTQDGIMRWVQMSAVLIPWNGQEADLYVLVDITAAREAEEKIRSLSQFQKSVIDHADIWMHVNDPDGNVILWNKAACQISGYSEADVFGRPVWSQLYPGNDVQKGIHRQTQDLLKDRGDGRPIETEITRKDGTPRTLVLQGQKLYNDAGHLMGVSFLGRDITEQVELERQFHQAQKMEAVGRMAGAMAHDFNNLLTVIRGYCELTQIKLDPGSTVYPRIVQIDRAAQRAESLTQQLLAFSRNQVMASKKIDVSALVRDMRDMLGRLIDEDVDLVIREDGEPATIEADPSKIEQVIMNLVVNARDAMAYGGVLTIEVDRILIGDSPPDGCDGLDPGVYVQVSVADTGTGMDDRVRERIFEPFFTTKEKGKGSGLGLSTAYGIVRQSGGDIRIKTALGQGTSVSLLFPQVGVAADVDEISPEAPVDLRGTETILVVEDQVEVMKMTSEALYMHGYRVLEAPNPGTALLLFEEYKTEVSLVLTDVVMPIMNGVQLVTRLQESQPNLKVLFMSGYTDNIVGPQGSPMEPGRNFIQKPFSATSLLHMIRTALDDGKHLQPELFG